MQKNEYLKNPKLCPNCGKVIPYEKRNNKCCSQSCGTSLANKERPPMKDEIKQKISKTIKSKLQSGEIKFVNQFTKTPTKFYNPNDAFYHINISNLLIILTAL